MPQVLIKQELTPGLSIPSVQLEWKRRTGEDLSRQAVQRTIERALGKIRRALEEDPETADLLGLEIGLHDARNSL